MNTSEGLADLVAAEDVLLFVNAAITATGQREFRPGVPGAMDQRLSPYFLHTYVRVNYRRVYAASPALDINDHNAARIVLGLLESAGEAGVEERRVEGGLIAVRLAVLPPPRAYRLFGAVRRAGINNRRTRAIMRDRLAARPDLGHDAVKYRGGVRTAARHVHLRCPPGAEPLAEVGAFLFRPGRPVRCCGCGGCGWTRSGGRPWCTSTPYTTPGDSTYGGWRPGFRRPGSGTRRICPGQCGVMVYVSDALAAAFVVPHPEDYRLPHAWLVEDLFGELVHQYGLYGAPVAEFGARIRGEDHIRTLAGLRAAARGRERAWEEAHDRLFARELLNTSYGFERVYRMGSFTLWRFLLPFVRDGTGRDGNGRGDSHRPQGAGGLPQDVPALRRPGPARPSAPHPGRRGVGAVPGRRGARDEP
ncbi:ARPP-2 domain-containing protein [Streptomyces bacillaris]